MTDASVAAAPPTPSQRQQQNQTSKRHAHDELRRMYCGKNGVNLEEAKALVLVESFR